MLGSSGSGQAADGLQFPPPLLMIQVSGHADRDEFYESGRVAKEILCETIDRHAEGNVSAMLDFGCGCGRVARHWADLADAEIHGCDPNLAAVAWCRHNLPFMQAQRSEFSPPLPHSAARFDFVYALSVFTHLSERMQKEWMAELRRVIRPGGLLFFTTKGHRHAHELGKLGRSGLEDYRAGQLVVMDEEVEGTNLCAAYHPYEWVTKNLLKGFELLEYAPGGAVMNGEQDFYVTRRL